MARAQEVGAFVLSHSWPSASNVLEYISLIDELNEDASDVVDVPFSIFKLQLGLWLRGSCIRHP